MSKILSGLHGILSFMEVLMVFGSDTKEHNENLTATLRRITAGVALKHSVPPVARLLLPSAGFSF